MAATLGKVAKRAGVAIDTARKALRGDPSVRSYLIERVQQAAKDLIGAVNGQPIDASISEETAQRIARQRATDEAKDGIAAFLDKRPPAWL